MNARGGAPAARRLLVPGLMTAIMVLVLCGLGTWQVYRLQWKLAVLAQIAASEQAPPVPLGSAPTAFQKVAVSGRFDYAKAALFGAEVRDTKAGPTMGAYQIVPLMRDGAPPILVERGWIPQPGTVPRAGPTEKSPRAWSQSPVTCDPASTTLVQPRGRPARAALLHSGYRRHRPRARTAGVPAPFILVALGPNSTDKFPVPAQHLPQPPNNHLSYAITWYGLAVAASPSSSSGPAKRANLFHEPSL